MQKLTVFVVFSLLFVYVSAQNDLVFAAFGGVEADTYESCVSQLQSQSKEVGVNKTEQSVSFGILPSQSYQVNECNVTSFVFFPINATESSTFLFMVSFASAEDCVLAWDAIENINNDGFVSNQCVKQSMIIVEFTYVENVIPFIGFQSGVVPQTLMYVE